MRLDTIRKVDAMPDRSPVDIDAALRIGPMLSSHIAAIGYICRTLPNHLEILSQLEALKNCISSIVPMADNVLETAGERIYDYDVSKPFSQQRVRTGAGSASIGFLPTKLINEAARLEDLVKDVDVIEKMAKEKKDGMDSSDVKGSIDSLIHYNKQVSNTLLAFTEAVLELRNRAGSMESIAEDLSYVDGSVDKLESRLAVMASNGSTLDYRSIDEVMKQICREDGCSTGDLHERFKQKHQGMIPDEWAMKSSIGEELADVASRLYEGLSEKLGEKAWTIVSKKLVSDGHNRERVNEAINKAVIRKLA